VRARAAGADLESAVWQTQAALPHYRFTFMVAKANELAAELRNLGGALLAALEKRDAEALALLRSTQEVALLQAVQSVKKKQAEEAQATFDSLERLHELADIKYRFYSSRAFMNPAELASVEALGASIILMITAQGLESGSAIAHFVPDFTLGGAGAAASPVSAATFGGSNVGNAGSSGANALNVAASILNTTSTMMGTLGGFMRRQDEWDMLAALAAKELEQTQLQIMAAQSRVEAANQDVRNQDLQITQSQNVLTFLQDKFTNRDLYDWMVGQTASAYFQVYQVAFDLAKQAERAFQFERGFFDPNKLPTFIQFGAWDNLKQGLVAGERLTADLRRMESAYLDQNARELELTKQISIALVAPVALQELRKNGSCVFNLTEDLFDLDFPGHYMRRIKSVSLTVPCVVGPYTGVNTSLTLQSSELRFDSRASATDYAGASKSDPRRYLKLISPVEAIATSTAQADAGLFEVNFRDERYLPFEGAGAISTWQLEFPSSIPQFDWMTITDVVVQLRYTARDGGDGLRQIAASSVSGRISGKLVILSARSDFENAWEQFLNPTSDTADFIMALPVSRDVLPFAVRDRSPVISAITLYPIWNDLPAGDSPALTFYVQPAGRSTELSATGTTPPSLSGLPFTLSVFNTTGSQIDGDWTVRVARADLEAAIDATPGALSKLAQLADIGIAFLYDAQPAPTGGP
jgi:hypothetical protein